MDELFWDATFAIVTRLIERYPELHPETVGLEEMANLIINLPEFADDPELRNERILLDIQLVWYEEYTE